MRRARPFAADRRTPIRRAYLDLAGLRPLMKSKRLTGTSHRKHIRNSSTGCRRQNTMAAAGAATGSTCCYAEDNPTGEAAIPYPFAWRDWVIRHQRIHAL